MASFLVIGDLHIHTNNLDEMEILVEKLQSIALETNPDVIVLLGDLLDTMDIIRAQALTLATNLLAVLSKIAPLLILIGNHDVPGPLSYFSNIHGFNALKLWTGTQRGDVSFPSGSGVQVVDTEVVIFKVRGMSFCALPYIPPGRFQEALSTNEVWCETKIIFCHQEFTNCDLGSGRISTCKDEWSSEFPQVVSGHIHKHQRVGPNVLYCGTPRQVSLSEEPYKTVSLINYDGRLSERRISTELPPRLHLKISASEVNDVEVPDVGRIKIEITGTLSENLVAKRSLRVKQWRRNGFTIKFHNLVEEEEEVREFPSFSFKEICRSKAEEQDLTDEYFEIFG